MGVAANLVSSAAFISGPILGRQKKKSSSHFHTEDTDPLETVLVALFNNITWKEKKEWTSKEKWKKKEAPWKEEG